MLSQIIGKIVTKKICFVNECNWETDKKKFQELPASNPKNKIFIPLSFKKMYFKSKLKVLKMK